MTTPDVVSRAKAALEAPCHCSDCGDDDCGWQRYDQQMVLAELVPELIAELERLRMAEVERIRVNP